MRLAPYTKILPKPLLPIGEIPILEVLLRQMQRAGVEHAVLTVVHLAQLLRSLRSHGITTMTWDRHKGHAWNYDVVDRAYNYRLDEIRAAIGRVQLRKLEGSNERRRVLDKQYVKI
jgi:NDP-sugar pyrophosphorylase family protein